MEKSRLVFKRNFVLILAATIMMVSGACSSQPCREPRAPEMDVTKAPSAAGPSILTPPATAGMAPVLSPTSSTQAKLPQDSVAIRIRVYKPDGSRQCEKGGAVSAETMERELAGIRVYSKEKRKDGLMHIQVCGSPSGMINVFEVDSTFQKQAEERGFKRLED